MATNPLRQMLHVALAWRTHTEATTVVVLGFLASTLTLETRLQLNKQAPLQNLFSVNEL